MFDQSLWQAILERFASGETILDICRGPIQYGDGLTTTIDRTTVFAWQRRDPALRADYVEAEELHLHAVSSTLIDIIDGPEGADDVIQIQRDSLRFKGMFAMLESRVSRFNRKAEVMVSCPPLNLTIGEIPAEHQDMFGADSRDSDAEQDGRAPD